MTVLVSWVGEVVTVAVTGSVEAGRAGRLRQVLAAAVDRRPTGVIVDLGAVDVLTEAGIAVLVDAAAHAHADGTGAVVVVAPTPATGGPLAQVGSARSLTVVGDLSEARRYLSATPGTRRP